MNILVIGNGFDLAHGLPTRYTDFLGFCERVSPIYTYSADIGCEEYIRKNLDKWDMNDRIKNH